MAKVLVTGARGFVGAHLVPILQADGHKVIGVNREAGDVSDDATWAHFPKADIVVHLAGKTFVPDSWNDPSSFLRSNLLGTVGALNYCRAHGSQLVFLSSYLYGNSPTLPIAESAQLVATNPYALSKKLSEEACVFYVQSFGVDVAILRPFNVYGPGQPDHFLIPSIVRQLNGGESIHVMDLEPKRDYVYVSDLADAIALVIKQPRRFLVLNIGTGESHSVAELINTLQRLKHTDLPVTSARERRPDEILDCRADISAAQREIGWSPRVTLDEGLRRILES
jgi:nucleoside-diphosphate-sugar epimerase